MKQQTKAKTSCKRTKQDFISSQDGDEIVDLLRMRRSHSEIRKNFQCTEADLRDNSIPLHQPKFRTTKKHELLLRNVSDENLLNEGEQDCLRL